MSLTWDGGFHERDSAYYSAVGFLCHQWNSVEHLAYSLAPSVMGMKLSFHELLFRHLSIKSVQAFIEDYVRINHDAAALEQVQYVNRYVERCRINRNLVVHSSPTSDPETAVQMLRSPADKNRKAAKSYPRSVETIRRLCDECETAGRLLMALQLLLMPESERDNLTRLLFGDQDWRSRLLAKPPLPVSLAEHQHTPPGHPNSIGTSSM